MSMRDTQSGATMVEFSIAAAFIFTVIFSLIEVARYTASLGVLSAAADRAMALASSDYRLLEPEGSPKYNQAVLDIQKRFQDSLAGSWIGLNPQSGSSVFLQSDISTLKPVLPVVQGDEASINEALLNRPVILEFTASMKPLIPCSGAIFNQKGANGCGTNIPIRIFSASFKEPYKALTMPSSVDCQGRPPSSPSYNTDCACDVDKFWDDASGGCVCYTGDANSDSVCDCPPNKEFNIADKTCSKCTLSPESCTAPGTKLDTTICGCVCDTSLGVTESSTGSCTDCIYSAQTYSNGSCKCDDSAKDACNADPTQIWDDSTCSCACKSGLAQDGLGSCTKCADPARKFENGNCNSCVLTSAQCNDTKGGSLNTTTCGCECNYNLQGACANAGGTFDPITCACDCGEGAVFNWSTTSAYGSCSCLGGLVRKYDNNGKGYCTCNAASGLTDDGAGGCKCTAGSNATLYFPGMAWQYCACNSTVSCPPINGVNQMFDNTTCQCGCGPN